MSVNKTTPKRTKELKLKTTLDFGKFDGMKVMYALRKDPAYFKHLHEANNNIDVHQSVLDTLPFYERKSSTK